MVEDPAGGPHTTLSSGAKIIGGAYEVERLIKAGGMGEVYRGRNVQTGRNVAIKIILASLARDEKYMALFEREALILEELSHEAIVRYQLYAVDQTTGRPCLVMQFVPGPSLKERMEQGPMPGDEIRTLARRLAAGLQAAHNHEYRVYHRDLSPDNVILEDGKVEKAKLIDFGIAKGGAQSNEKSMLAGQIAGKFSYMAPEQLGLFGDDIDARTDIYSLGLILLGLFRGKAVDMGKNVGEAVMRRQSVPDLSAAAPEMQPLLERMLAPQPEHRPANMGEVLQMLDQARPARPRPLSEASETTVVMPKIARPAPEAAPPVAAPVPPPVAAPVAPVAPPPVAPSPAAVVAPPPAAPAENLDATVIKPLPPSAPAAAPAPLPPVETRRPPEVVKAEAAKPVKSEPAKAEAPAKAPPSKPEAPKSEGGKSAGQKSDGQKSDAAAELDALFDVSRPASPSAAAASTMASGSGPSIMGTAAQAAKPAPAPVQKKSALPMILAGVAVLALGGGGAYVFLGSSSPPTPAAVETAAKTPEPAVEAPKTAAAEPEKAPEPKPEPKPDPALQRAGLQDQLAALSGDLSGSCRFLRLAPETAGAAPLVLALAPSAQSASEALARLTLPGEAAAPQAKSLTLPDTPAFCGAVELANLAHVPGPLGLQVTGLTQGKVKAGQSLTGTLTGADANTRLYLIGGATGRVTPLALEGGRFALTLDLAAPGQAQELLLAIAPDGALPSLAEIQDGQAADSVIRHIAHGLKTEGRKASFDLLPFTLEK